MVSPESYYRDLSFEDLRIFGERVDAAILGNTRWGGWVDDLFSDGSAANSTDPETRFASWAVVRCSGHRSCLIQEGKVFGGLQTVPTAELTAVVVAMLVSRKVRIHSDCKYVVNGFERLDKLTHPKANKSDLWRLVKRMMDKGWEVVVVNMKAHTEEPEPHASEQNNFWWAEAAAKEA